MSKEQLKSSKGYSLVELILAMALFSAFAGAIIFMVLGSLSSNRRASMMTQAKSYLEESNEAMRAISLEAFNFLEPGIYGLNYNTTDNKWELATTPDDPDGTGPFISRTIAVADVSRDTNGDIVEEGTNDPFTHKISTTVEWTVEGDQTTSLSSEIYLTAWEGQDWTQTDWAGSGTQADWASGDTTAYESDDGNVDVSTSGQIKLNEIITDYTYNWSFNDTDNYNLYQGDVTSLTGTDDPIEIDETSGLVQLIEIENLLETENQDFSQGTGSEPDNWGNDAGYGTWHKTGGGYDDDYYVDISYPNNSSAILTDYWEQIITTTKDNPSPASITFKWQCSEYLVRDPDQLTLFATIESATGAPSIVDAVWSTDITSSGGWQTATLTDVSSEFTTAGDYYLKVALYIDYKNGKKQGPFTVELDNVDLEITNQGYATDKPFVEVNDSGAWEPEFLGMITGFNETATKPAGTEIYYQISSDNGSTWYYYNTTTEQWQSTSSLTNANNASDVDSYIKYLPVDNDSQIKFRALLESDGDTLVQLQDVEFEYNPDTITMEAGAAAITEDWTEISLTNTYTDPVVVAIYLENTNFDSPASIRIRNAGSNSFEAKIDFPTDNFTPVDYTSTDNINYIVIEKGYWRLPDGTYIEANTHDTATVGKITGWNADNLGYNLKYTKPIVLHQVMTDNDTNWISTWTASQTNLQAAPNSVGFRLGLQAAEVVPSYTHGSETIGYIVVEDVDTGSIDSNNFRTRRTTSTIYGHDNGCYTFNNYATFSSPVIIGSQQIMKGNNGGWLVRCDASANPKSAKFHSEEDQYRDNERAHTNEIAAYVVFEDGAAVNGKSANYNYQISGYLISSAFEATKNFNIISWDGDDDCTDCSIDFKIRTALDYESLSSATWYDYTDPALINQADHLNNTWIQYRVDLAGDGSTTPILNEMKINYY